MNKEYITIPLAGDKVITLPFTESSEKDVWICAMSTKVLREWQDILKQNNIVFRRGNASIIK